MTEEERQKIIINLNIITNRAGELGEKLNQSMKELEKMCAAVGEILTELSKHPVLDNPCGD